MREAEDGKTEWSRLRTSTRPLLRPAPAETACLHQPPTLSPALLPHPLPTAYHTHKGTPRSISTASQWRCGIIEWTAITRSVIGG